MNTTSVTGPDSCTNMSETKRERRIRLLANPCWQEAMEEAKRRGMIGPKSPVGYQDKSESIGTLLQEIQRAVPISSNRWMELTHRKGGKPRGLSVNPGNKWGDSK